MIRGKKYFNKDVVYTSLTKHFCPNCNGKLKTIKMSKIVNFKSPEAEKFDFRFGSGDHVMVVNGDVKFIWKEFECPNCRKHFTVEELKKIEGIEVDESSVDEKTMNVRNKSKDVIIFCLLGIVFIIIIWLVQNIFK